MNNNMIISNLEDINNALVNLQKITFADGFNQPLKNSLDNLINLEELSLNIEYNNNLNLQNNIKILNINYLDKFVINKFMENLSDNIEQLNIIRYISFGIKYELFTNLNDFKFKNLPSSIKILKIKNQNTNIKLNINIKYLYKKCKILLNDTLF